jgi:hypothetical protein
VPQVRETRPGLPWGRTWAENGFFKCFYSMSTPQQLYPNKIKAPPTINHPNPHLYRVSIPKAKRTPLTYRAYRPLFPHHPHSSQKGRGKMKFDHLDKTKDLAHRVHRAGGLMAHKALKAHTSTRTLHHNQTSGPRAAMRALLQPKLRVRLSGPSRQIAKRTNRINGLIWINPVDELMKGHIFPGIFTPHAGVPGNRGCRA